MQLQTEKRALMSENPFIAFIDLITLDQKIRTIHDQITALKKSMQDQVTQKNEITTRFDTFKNHVKELRKMVDAQELEMKDLDQKERVKREQLEQSNSTKEYQLLKKEIEHLKHEQNKAESTLLGIWNKLEITQKDLQEQQAGFDTKIQEIHSLIFDNQVKVDALQHDLDLLTQERPDKEACVSQEWLSKYTHMRMRVADPVVAVMSGSCGVCFYSITDQELLRLNRRALVQCKGCFRLLYMQEAMDRAVQEEHKD